MNLQKIANELTKEEKIELAKILYEKEPYETIVQLALFRTYEKLKEFNAGTITPSVEIVDPETKEKFLISAEYKKEKINS